MAKNISRTIKTFTINAEGVGYKDGKMEVVQLEPLETPKKLSNNAIEKHFKKLVDEGYSIVVKSITEKENIYEVPLEKFMEIAKLTDNTTEAE